MPVTVTGDHRNASIDTNNEFKKLFSWSEGIYAKKVD